MLWPHLIFLCFRLSLAAPAADTLVYPRLLEARGVNGQRLLRIHEGLTLEIEKASVLAEDFMVTTFEGDKKIHTLINGKKLEENLYHDTENLAVVTVKENGDSLEVEGILNDKLRIRPNLAAARSDDGQIAHTIFEVEKPEPHDILVHPVNGIEERNLNPRHRYYYYRPTTTTRKPTPLPETVVVEVKIAVCQTYYGKFQDMDSFLLYAAILFHSASLRFSIMKSPKISLKLVGLLRPRDAEVLHEVGGHVDASETLDKMANFFEKHHKTDHMDVLVLITAKDLADCDATSCTSASTTGIAYLGGMCSKQKMALVEDTVGAFSGDHTVAHELAHSMGSTHDGDPPATYIKGNGGAQHCPWDRGYMMSYKDGGPLHHQPSLCTMQQIKVFLAQQTEECIEVKVTFSVFSDTKLLPGSFFNGTKYCEKRHRNNPDIYYHGDSSQERVCKMLCCERVNKYKSTCEVHSMLNGMRCGDHKKCLHGVCSYHN